jgi:hypothetical protein
MRVRPDCAGGGCKDQIGGKKIEAA